MDGKLQDEEFLTDTEMIDFVPKVFFFDRVSPAILKLATTFKEKGAKGLSYVPRRLRGSGAKVDPAGLWSAGSELTGG